jgi:ribose/xylose/arabinose/galactoside ABC-type transport system permease subunit
MATVVTLSLMYLAVGAAFFAQPQPGTATLADFTLRRQGEIFRDTLPTVLLWPIALWRLLAN